MGLIDELRAAAGQLDPQFVPTSNETGPLLAALIGYVEHGDSFLEAAGEGADSVTELVATPPADAEGHEGTPEERDKAASKASRAATAKQTKAEHETGGGA